MPESLRRLTSSATDYRRFSRPRGRFLRLTSRSAALRVGGQGSTRPPSQGIAQVVLPRSDGRSVARRWRPGWRQVRPKPPDEWAWACESARIMLSFSMFQPRGEVWGTPARLARGNGNTPRLPAIEPRSHHRSNSRTTPRPAPAGSRSVTATGASLEPRRSPGQHCCSPGWACSRCCAPRPANNDGDFREPPKSIPPRPSASTA